jgi:hypothetical protein
MPVAGVLELLRQALRLTTLTLKMLIGDPPAEPVQPVTLFLERAEIVDDLAASLALLQHLRLPASATVTVEGCVTYFAGNEEDATERLIHRHLACDAASRRGASLRTLRFVGQLGGRCHAELAWAGAGTFVLRHDSLSLAALLAFVCAGADLAHVAALEVSAAREPEAWRPRRVIALPSPAECAALLAEMPRLETLCLVHEDVGRCFAAALSHPSAPCPSLRTLRFLQQDVCAPCARADADTESLFPHTGLAELLCERVRAGVGLDELVFEGHFGVADALPIQRAAWAGTAACVRVHEVDPSIEHVYSLAHTGGILTSPSRQARYRRCARGPSPPPEPEPTLAERRAAWANRPRRSPSPDDPVLGKLYSYETPEPRSPASEDYNFYCDCC